MKSNHDYDLKICRKVISTSQIFRIDYSTTQMELSILTFMMNKFHTIWKYIIGYPWLTLYLYDSVNMKRLCTHLKSWSYAMVSLCTPNQWDWLKHLWIRCSSNCNMDLFINNTIDSLIRKIAMKYIIIPFLMLSNQNQWNVFIDL